MSNFYSFYPPAGGGSNPSIGANGAPAPTSSTEIGGVNPEGNLTPVAVTDSGAVFTTPAVGSVQHVIVDSSALPTGASTSANQATIIANQTNGTQETQIVGTVPLPTGAATSANQTSQITQETAIATSTASIDTKTPTLGQKTMSGSQPVAIASDQSAIPVTIATVPLPTGAATSANQVLQLAQETASAASLVSIDAGIPAALGQTTMSASMPVTIASDQTAIKTTDNTLDTYITGAGPATAVINTNILLAVTGTGSLDLQGSRSIAFQIVTGASTTAVAVLFEASNDNVTFVAVGMYDKTTATAAPVTTFTTAASTNRYFEGPTEFRYFRVRLNVAITAGTIQAFTILRASTYQMTNNSLAAGTQAIGSVTVASGTITAVTAITNALPAGTNNIGLVGTGGSTGVSNAPVQNVYSSTNVTTAAYVQLIASTTAATNYIDIFDSSGQAMIIGTGTAGSEVILCYVPPGGDQIRVQIPISTRIAIKALTATANSGYLLLNCWK